MQFLNIIDIFQEKKLKIFSQIEYPFFQRI